MVAKANSPLRLYWPYFWPYFIAGVAALILADQLSKAAVQSLLPAGSQVIVTSFFGITNVANTGSIFGILKGTQPFLVALSAAVTAFILLIYRFLNTSPERISAILIASGAFGNMIDRLFRGAVIDFLYFPFWPAFNLADSFLTVGAVTLLISLFAQWLRKKRRN